MEGWWLAWQKDIIHGDAHTLFNSYSVICFVFFTFLFSVGISEKS